MADASPLIALVNVGAVRVLPELFGRVVVPSAVVEELRREGRPAEVRGFVEGRPAWLEVRVPATTGEIGKLHAGETAAIHLAEELGAELLLIDEVQGRRVAAGRRGGGAGDPVDGDGGCPGTGG